MGTWGSPPGTKLHAGGLIFLFEEEDTGTRKRARFERFLCLCSQCGSLLQYSHQDWINALLLLLLPPRLDKRLHPAPRIPPLGDPGHRRASSGSFHVTSHCGTRCSALSLNSLQLFGFCTWAELNEVFLYHILLLLLLLTGPAAITPAQLLSNTAQAREHNPGAVTLASSLHASCPACSFWLCVAIFLDKFCGASAAYTKQAGAYPTARRATAK